MHTTESLGIESISFEVQIATDELKRYKSPGVNQISAELLQAACNALCPEIH
jgi:hypothetical protein